MPNETDRSELSQDCAEALRRFQVPASAVDSALLLGDHRIEGVVWPTRPRERDLAALLAKAQKRLVFAPFIAPPVAAALRAADQPYVDRSGNAWIRWGSGLIAIEGRPATDTARRPRPAQRESGLQLFLALLADPSLVNAPVRTLVQRSGTSLGTVVNVLARLRDEGLLVSTADRPSLVDPLVLRERYVAGWARQVRPGHLAARGRPGNGIPIGEAMEWLRGSRDAMLGGEAGARLWLGDDLATCRQATIHIAELSPATWRSLRLTPDPQGPVHLITRVGPAEVGPFAEGIPLVHPVVLQAELLALAADPALGRDSATLRGLAERVASR